MTKPYRRVPLANTIHQWRQRHILSEKECAKIFGITTKRLYRIELHHHTALPPHIVALMRQLDEEWGECRLYDAIAHKLPPYDPSKDPPKKRKSPTMKPKPPADPAAVSAPKPKRGRPAGSGRKRTIIPPPGLPDALTAMETAEKDRAKRFKDAAAPLRGQTTITGHLDEMSFSAPTDPKPLILTAAGQRRQDEKDHMPFPGPQKPVQPPSTIPAPTLPATPPKAAQPPSLTAAMAEIDQQLREAEAAFGPIGQTDREKALDDLVAESQALGLYDEPGNPPPLGFPDDSTLQNREMFPDTVGREFPNNEPRELPPPGFVEAIAAVPPHEPAIPWDTPQAHPQPLTARPIIPPTKTRRAPSQAPRRMPSPLPAAPGVKPPGEWE